METRINRILDESRRIPKALGLRGWTALAASIAPLIYLAAAVQLAPAQTLMPIPAPAAPAPPWWHKPRPLHRNLPHGNRRRRNRSSPNSPPPRRLPPYGFQSCTTEETRRSSSSVIRISLVAYPMKRSRRGRPPVRCGARLGAHNPSGGPRRQQRQPGTVVDSGLKVSVDLSVQGYRVYRHPVPGDGRQVRHHRAAAGRERTRCPKQSPHRRNGHEVERTSRLGARQVLAEGAGPQHHRRQNQHQPDQLRGEIDAGGMGVEQGKPPPSYASGRFA